MCIKVMAFVIHDSWKLINMNYIEAFMLKNSPSSKRTAIFFLVLSLAQGFDVCFEVCCDLWERAVMCVRLSLCLDDLFELLGLLTQLFSWGEALPHLHEECRYLVAAQKACCPPFQPMQNTCLHCSCVETNTWLQKRKYTLYQSAL